METQAKDNTKSEVSEAKEPKRKRKGGYNQKLSAKLYKRFSLLTFFVYYLNLMVRIITRCVSFYDKKEIHGVASWWAFISDFSNWKEIFKDVFDWYTITLVVFLLLYTVVFLFTFIRFSPQHKKTFKYFKKGFLMARRLIKIINLGLSITVLINSVRLLTLADKVLFVWSLFTLLFTLMQICTSITTWVISRKLSKKHTSFRAYMGKVGNVVNNYVTSSGLRPEGSKKSSIGDKMGIMRNRFFRTVEALTYTYDEARENDRRYSGESLGIDSKNTDRFENDYVEPVIEVEAVTEQETEGAKPKLKLSEKLKNAKIKKAEDKEAHVREKTLKKTAKINAKERKVKSAEKNIGKIKKDL